MRPFAYAPSALSGAEDESTVWCDRQTDRSMYQKERTCPVALARPKRDKLAYSLPRQTSACVRGEEKDTFEFSTKYAVCVPIMVKIADNLQEVEV